MSAKFPSFTEAWSLRAHRLGERATRTWAAVCAAIALAAFLVSTALVLTDAVLWPGSEVFRLAVSVFAGPLALALSAVVLWQQSGRISAPAALFTAVAAVPALALATLAMMSWSAGFRLADAGISFSWFEAATLPFALAAWIAGSAAVSGLIGALWTPRSAYARSTKIALLSGVTALCLGLLSVTAFLLAPLAAAALLVASLRTDRGEAPDQQAEPEAPPLQLVRPSTTVHPSNPGIPSRRLRLAVAGIGFATLLIGVGCAWFALSGSRWPDLAADSTAAMNLGLAAGALNAVPLTAAVGMVLYPSVGRVTLWAAVLAAGSLLAEAGAQLAGAGDPAQWPLSLAAGILFGFALALPFARLIPGSALMRTGATAGVGLAASFIGLNVVAAAGFIAPLASAALLVWAFWPPSARSASLQPA